MRESGKKKKRKKREMGGGKERKEEGTTPNLGGVLSGEGVAKFRV